MRIDCAQVGKATVIFGGLFALLCFFLFEPAPGFRPVMLAMPSTIVFLGAVLVERFRISRGKE